MLSLNQYHLKKSYYSGSDKPASVISEDHLGNDIILGVKARISAMNTGVGSAGAPMKFLSGTHTVIYLL